MARQQRIVIIGAGFAGLYAAQTLARSDVEIILIDRNNFHTFTPLLYQVATCALDPSSIAYPVRTIFRKQKNVQFLMGEVQAIDYDARQIAVQTAAGERVEAYDYLLLAAGSVTNFFGQSQIADQAFELKTLDDAVRLRNHILGLFERAAWSDDPVVREALTTMVVVGGGPTGLETAGALFELYNHVLRQEYGDRYQALRARVILLEARDTVLAAFPSQLQASAVQQLKSLGVEVLLNAAVAKMTPELIQLSDGRSIATHTVIWSAGVQSAPIVRELDVALKQAMRLPALPTLQVPERERVYAAGDLVYLEDASGQPYPMLIPVAKQQGILAARNILREIHGQALEEFRYQDRGIMATIGRSRAVAWIFYRVQLSGYIAWLAWLFLHLVALIGFRNRLAVLFSWVWNYLTYDRSVRIILNRAPQPDALSDSVAKESA